MILYRDELLQLHQFLLYFSKFLMDNGIPKSCFEEYEKIGVSPHHVQKTNDEHRCAVFALARCLSKVLSEQGIVPRDVATMLGKLAQRRRADAAL